MAAARGAAAAEGRGAVRPCSGLRSGVRGARTNRRGAPLASATAALALAALSELEFCRACTNFIVTPGASADGSTLFSYTADSGALYGTLGHYPAARHSPGEMRSVWNWDTGAYLGEIEEAEETFNVIGNLNEHGLAIGETTFGGNETLAGGEGVLDYGSLIWITLQRARTAREAVNMFGELVAKYGYVSEGESFTIGDPREVWVLELIGKGKYEKGAVWVAVRIPDGQVSGHANQARIQQFPLNDPDNCVYSEDVISFAVKVGLWPADRPKEQFSFSDTYDPITFFGARLSDARVWSFFSTVAEDRGFEKKFEAYVLGQDLNVTSRMPLHIKPKAKLTNLELMNHMRNHYDGTALDPTKDVGAGGSGTPYRRRPLTWKFKNDSYVNERTVGTQQTGWNFVAQLRGHLPPSIGGLLWFGVDDATFSIRVPFHAGETRVPKAFADGTGDALTWSMDSAFWAFNAVANFVYPRWATLARPAMERAANFEASFAMELAIQEPEALAILKDKGEAAALEHLTALSDARSERVVRDEFEEFGRLMVTYRDGFQISPARRGPDGRLPDHGGAQGGIVPKVKEVGYEDPWYARIVNETGDHYKMTDNNTHPDMEGHKLKILSRGVVPQGAPASGAFGPRGAEILV